MSVSNLTRSFAAIDLGSNSFHMVVAEPEGRSIRIIDSLRVPVRLGAGLDEKKRLKAETRQVALDALGQFAQRLRGVPLKQIRIVGTNTLRRAKESQSFMEQAYAILGKRIDIISGREEARLIFSAVSHTAHDSDTSRLVLDIGGGSTELIIGRGYKPEVLESINIGCVSFTSQFFSVKNGKPRKCSAANIKKASLQAQMELQPIAKEYLETGWSEVTGCSGTIKAVSRMLSELNITDGDITRTGVRELIQAIDSAGGPEKLNLSTISSDRSAVICGGIAIVHAIMKTLKIKSMQASTVALREGIIFDMVGKAEHVDIQSQTLANLASRYGIRAQQAIRVETTVSDLFNQVADAWELDEDNDLPLLQWAAKLHELGKAVAHTQYHKHGAYIIENSDLMGFSKAEQNALSLLIRFHRRKIDMTAFEHMTKAERIHLLRLLSLIRLAVLIHRGRHRVDLNNLKLKAKEDQLVLQVDEQWLEENPLTSAELSAEADRLLKIDFKLKTTDLQH